MKTTYVTLAITHKRLDLAKLATMAANHVYTMEGVANCEVVEVPAAPEMDDRAWAELYRLREAVKGPAGFATWQDLAIHLRQELKAVRPAAGEKAMVA